MECIPSVWNKVVKADCGVQSIGLVVETNIFTGALRICTECHGFFWVGACGDFEGGRGKGRGAVTRGAYYWPWQLENYSGRFDVCHFQWSIWCFWLDAGFIIQLLTLAADWLNDLGNARAIHLERGGLSIITANHMYHILTI